MLPLEERGKFIAAALKAEEEPVFVDCTGVSEDNIRNIYKVLSAEIFNEKTGNWQKVELTEYLDACPICGKLMKVRAIVGTTWLAACCPEHSGQALKDVEEQAKNYITNTMKSIK